MTARKAFLGTLVAALALPGLAFRADAQTADWKQIQIPPLPEFHPEQPRRVRLSNGMVIMLQEDHELPLIRGTARIRGGGRDEPAAKVGLVSVYGEVWRTGGTKSQTGDELDDYLEARGARVETAGGIDATSISWDCLKENLDDVLKVFVELLKNPAFREDKIPLAKNQIDTAISRRNDDPEGIASREARKLVYGADSPYARQVEYATVAAVTRDDLLSWRNKWVHPNNIILGVVGDFDAQDMERKLRAAFESWPPGQAPASAEFSAHGARPGVYFIAKDDVDQSNIRMVELGTRRDSPDYYAIEVFNQIFGGSFSSRLVQVVRTEKGLGYSVRGGIGTEYDHPGYVQISLGTKSTTTLAGIRALDGEIDRLKTHPPSGEELKKAKDSILNSFVFQFDSREKVLNERMAYEFYGYPADFLERYRDGIQKVTLADVDRVAQKYVHKDQLALLVVGKAADFDQPLSTLGQVATLDISIPTATPSGGGERAASNPEGRALLAKVIEGAGGAEKVRSVKSVRTKISILANTPQGEVSLSAEQVAIYPDHVWQKLSTPAGEMTIVVSPAVAFMKGPMGSHDLPASQKEEIQNELKRDPFFVAQHADDPKFTFSAGGIEKVGDVDARILDVNADSAQVRWFVDPKDGRILRTSAQSLGMNGPGELVVEFANWKSVQGLSVPFKETRTRGGEKEATVDIDEYEINPTVDPKLFDKPAEKPAEAPKQP